MLPLFAIEPRKSGSVLVLLLLMMFARPANSEITLPDFTSSLQPLLSTCRSDSKEFYSSPHVGMLYQMYIEGQIIGDKPRNTGFLSFLCDNEESTLYYYLFSTATAARNMLSYFTSFIWGETEAPSEEHPEAVIVVDNIIVVVSGRNVGAAETRALDNFARQKWKAVSVGRVFGEGMRLLEDKNYTEASKQFLVLGKLEHTGAQNALCAIYNETEQFLNALHWCSKAAQLGQQAAQYVLGSLYWSGRGIAKDETQGLHWWQEAAQSGFAPAQYKLALLYETGNVVDQNTDTALRYYRLAADRGYTDAQVRLAQIYLSGELVAPDLQQALTWLQAASLGANPEAASMLNYINEHMVTDISTEALDSIMKKLKCESPVEEPDRFACDCLAEFYDGQRPDTMKFNRKRLVGVGVAYNDDGAQKPYFELSGMELRQRQEIGDKLFKFNATPTEPGEAELIAAALRDLRQGKIPKDNFAYQFVLTGTPPNEPSIVLKGLSGNSLGSMDNGFRILLREYNNTLVALEIHPIDSEIVTHRFYIMRYTGY